MHGVAFGVQQLAVRTLSPRICGSEREARTAVPGPLEQAAPLFMFKLAIDLLGRPLPLLPWFEAQQPGGPGGEDR